MHAELNMDTKNGENNQSRSLNSRAHLKKEGFRAPIIKRVGRKALAFVERTCGVLEVRARL